MLQIGDPKCCVVTLLRGAQGCGLLFVANIRKYTYCTNECERFIRVYTSPLSRKFWRRQMEHVNARWDPTGMEKPSRVVEAKAENSGIQTSRRLIRTLIFINYPLTIP